MRLTQADLIAVERELCKRRLADFVKRAWHVIEPSQPYIHGWHIDAICEHLQAVTDGHINRLLINIPPGTAKSILTAVFWPAWEWGPRGMPNIRFIGASHEEGLATRDNLKMRRLVSSEWFQSRWPVELTGDQNQKTYFENTAAGWRQSCPVRSMTGRRGDRVLWDDPHNVEDAHSKSRLEEAARIFRETLPTRLNNPDRSAIVIIMQRLAGDDVSGEILASDYGYEHLCLPMEYESGRQRSTSIGFVDPRTYDGELLFPERFPAEVVRRDKIIMGTHAYAGQYQQRPMARGGNIIKGEWFARHAILPAIEYRMIYGDTAQKTKEANDYSVLECWGKGYDGKIYLLDMVRGRWEAPELENRTLAFWHKHATEMSAMLGPLRQMRIEDKASGTGLIQKLKRAIPISGIERNRDKYTRVMDVTGYIEAGFVSIPMDASFANDFTAECEAFTANDSHQHDDQIDPMIDAIMDMLQSAECVGVIGVMNQSESARANW